MAEKSSKTHTQTTNPGSSLDRVNVAEKFDALVATWRDETAYLSSITKIVNHPAYQKIIDMGWVVVPLILRDLEKEPDHWFHALYKITGINPVSPDSNFEQAAQECVQWGRDKGLIYA
jgi:hypothetical protein